MKYLLVVHDVYKEDNDFPLAEAYLAAILREKGHEVSVYCMDVFHQSNSELARYINHNNFDYVGIGFMSARYIETVRPLCHYIKKNCDIKLILGGHGPSAIPEFTLKDSKADIVIVGEAENIIWDLKDKEGVIQGFPVQDLDNLPRPAYDLFPINFYINNKQHPGQLPEEKSINISTSRGCVNKCTFCYRMEKGIRLRKINKVVDEIEYLHDQYGITYFYMTDELFVLSKARIKKFRDELAKRNLKISYWCNSRVNIIDEELLILLKESGCKFINYGFETMDQTVLDGINKNTTVEQNINAAELTNKCGIQMGLNFIWGMPYDSAKSLRDNVEFIEKYNGYEQLRTIRPVTPYPGCPLYYKAIEDGKLDGPEDFFKKFINSDLIMVNFTDMDLKDMYSVLLECNEDLIYDHYLNTTGNCLDGYDLVNQFRDLYSGKITKFRGARKYEKK